MNLRILAFVSAVLIGVLTSMALAVDAGGPKRLFYASFNNWDTVADEAGGNPKSDFNASLLLRQPQGAFSRAGIRIEPGESLAYDLPGNIDTRRGTISFWVKPFMWGPNHLSKRIVFFRVDMDDIQGWFSIARMEDSMLKWSMWGRDVMGGNPNAGQQAVARVPDWSQSPEWHRIDAVWDSIDRKEMAIYLDGKLENRVVLEHPIPLSTAGRIRLIPLSDWEGAPFNNTGETTLIDEVEIWDRPRPEADIVADYNRAKGLIPTDYSRPVLTVPPAAEAVTIDGHLQETAWTNASRIPLGLSVGPTGLAVETRATLAACYDARALYLAWSQRQEAPGAWHAAFAGGDGRVVQVRINVDGAVEVDGATQHAEVRSAVVREHELSVVEVAIPWDVLGVTPTAGNTHAAAFSVLNAKHASWNLMPTLTPDAKHFGTLVLGNSAAQLEDRSQWQLGVMDFTLRLPQLVAPVNATFEITNGGVVVVSERATITVGQGSWTLRQNLPEVPFGIAKIRVQQDGSNTPLFAYDLPIAVQPPMQIEYIPLVRENRFLFQIGLKGLPASWQSVLGAGKAELHAALRVPGTKTPATTSMRLTGDYQEVSLPVDPAWPAGTYTLALRLTNVETKQSLEYSKQITKPSTPWLGSNIGLDDAVVPNPWTPVQVNGDTVACWGREYRLSGAFLSSMKNQGKEMLAAPVRMTLTSGTNQSFLGIGPVTWQATQPAKAQFTGSSKVNGLAIDYSGTVEFDGLLLSTLTITPPAGGVQVDSLVLEIPLKSELVQLMRNPKMFVERGNPSTLVKQWDGKSIYTSPFKPYLWVGNLDVGFDWLCESDVNWNYAEGAQPCKILPQGEVATLRFEIVSQPAMVTKPLKYTFGFQATPVKPHRADWRRLRMTAGALSGGRGDTPYANATTVGYDYSFEYISWFVPQEWPRDTMQEIAPGFGNLDVKLRMFRKHGIKGLPYTSGILIADNNPVWDFFVGAWQNKQGPISRGNTGGGYKTRRDGKSFSLTGADPGSWSPFLAYMAHQLLGDPQFAPDLAGIYVDNTTPYPQNNPYNGSGYRDDAFGRSGYSVPILGLRDLGMRLLRVIREQKGPEGILILHAHNDLIVPVHGLADYFFPGEQYGYLIADKPYFYMEDLPLEVLRAETNQYAYGVPQLLLHMLPSAMPGPVVDHVYPVTRERGPTDSLIAVCALHDIPFALFSLNPDGLKEYFSIVDAEGMADAEFLPYWRESGLTTEDARAKISGYQTKNGVLAVIVNFSAEDREIAVDVRPPYFGWTNAAAVDLRRKSNVPVRDGRLVVQVKGRNYTIIRLTP
jgi:hypothetical protein